MEEVSPYSVDEVFLAQLVIIISIHHVLQLKTTIKNATIREVSTHVSV